MIVALFVAFVVAVLLAGLTRLWEAQAHRERERALLWTGFQFSDALASYAAVTPEGQPAAPQRLEDLLLDARVDPPVRHLRRVYADPLTGSSEWGLVLDTQGRIAGIHSRSPARPLPPDGVWPEVRAFAAARRYSDWVFRPGVR